MTHNVFSYHWYFYLSCNFPLNINKFTFPLPFIELTKIDSLYFIICSLLMSFLVLSWWNFCKELMTIKKLVLYRAPSNRLNKRIFTQLPELPNVVYQGPNHQSCSPKALVNWKIRKKFSIWVQANTKQQYICLFFILTNHKKLNYLFFYSSLIDSRS